MPWKVSHLEKSVEKTSIFRKLSNLNQKNLSNYVIIKEVTIISKRKRWDFSCYIFSYLAAFVFYKPLDFIKCEMFAFWKIWEGFLATSVYWNNLNFLM